MAYHRVLLKLSGEALGHAESGQGIDPDAVGLVARQVAHVASLGVEIALVVGGGNILRGAEFSKLGADRASADYMGMLATVINALALSDAIEKQGRDTRVMTAIEIKQVAEPFLRRRAIAHLEKGLVVILAAGTGNPFFTTDTAAALRARELGCEVLLKATKVDGVYTADPKRDRSAQRLTTLTHMQVLERQLKVMDTTAISLCMESHLPVVVFNLFEEGNIERVIRGENLGTIIRSSP
ncbi:MAG: UMP kinase [Planctomycetes bacterium]|nr:UMP kinase [Planctomycetota bacterium]